MKFVKILLPYILLSLSGSLLASELLIENVTLLSPERQRPLQHAYVRVEDGKIIEVSKAPLTAKTGGRRLDGTGQYLMPGLMDSHVHVSSMPGLLRGPNLQYLQDAFVKQQPRSYLYFGVTQLLDPSHSSEGFAKFNANPHKPDLFHCGSAPILGGYPTLWSSIEETLKAKPYIILEQTDKNRLRAGVDLQQHTPEAVVERMARDGAICVKVYIEDGFGLNNEWPMISEQLLNRVKAAAQKHGLLVMAHANAIDMQQIALNIGVDVMAHGMWNWNQYRGESGLPTAIGKILDGIIERKMVFQPTFNVMDTIKAITGPNVLADPLYAKVVPKLAMQWYNTEQALWYAEQLIKEFDGLALHKIHAHYDRVIAQGEQVVKYLLDHNLPMVLASDTPSSPTFAAQPGYSSFAELKHMFKAGLGLQRVFNAATINNARAFGLHKQYGTIEPGKVANLLLLNANPLENIEAYNTIDKVIIKGQPIARESLAAK